MDIEMSGDEIKDIKLLLSVVGKFYEKYKYDPFYNYVYREKLQIGELKTLFNNDDFQLHKGGTSGCDFISPSLNIENGELKSNWFKTKTLTKSSIGKLAFDKQPDEIRRQKVLEYDAIRYDLMRRDGTIIFSLNLFGMDNVKQIHSLIKIEQEKLIEKVIRAKENNKRLNRDDIKIPIVDVINVCDDDSMILSIQGERISKTNLLNMLKKRSIIK